MAAGPDAPETQGARPLGPIAAAAWTAVFLAVYATLLIAVAVLRPGSEFDQVSGSLISLASVLLVLLAISRVHAPGDLVRKLVGARPLRFGTLLGASFLGVSMVFPFRALDALIMRRFPMPAAQATELLRGFTVLGPRERIAGAVLGALAVPLGDELFFRGALATGMARSTDRRTALGVTVAAYVLVYGTREPHYLPYYALVGLVLGHARFATGSVLASIAAALSWRACELAYLGLRYRTIDPLTTELGAPPDLAPVLVAGSIVLGAFLAAVLPRLGTGGDADEITPRLQHLGPSSRPPGADDRDDRDEDDHDDDDDQDGGR